MCGIAGLVGVDRSLAEARVRHAIRSLAHRGPDGVGWYDGDEAVLGMCRLAIIDLAGGDQPRARAPPPPRAPTLPVGVPRRPGRGVGGGGAPPPGAPPPLLPGGVGGSWRDAGARRAPRRSAARRPTRWPAWTSWCAR